MRRSRRQFVKLLSLVSGPWFIAGDLWQADLMSICNPSADQTSAEFTVRVSDYPALQPDFGSVRLGINGVSASDEPFPDGNFWPILINRDDHGNFFVLD